MIARLTTHTLGSCAKLALLMVLLVLVSCGADDEANEPGERNRSVKLVTVNDGSQLAERRFVARVEALSTVDLAFQTDGRIETMLAREGSVVPGGALIARLERRDYELAVDEAETALMLSEAEYQRAARMLAPGAIAQSQYDRARAERDMRRVALEFAQRRLAYTELTAPFDALVTRRLVDAHTQTQTGTAVVRVQDVTELGVVIAVPENLMFVLADTSGLSAELSLSAFPGQRFELQYREHSTEADGVTQTYNLRFSLPRPEALSVLPGMTGTVSVRVREEASAIGITVPVAALDARSDGSFQVWVYDAQSGRVNSRAVQTGALGGDQVSIMDGLQPGEQIVAAGAHLLRENMPVVPFISNGEP